MQLQFPMILLSLKMSVEYIYRNSYLIFIDQNSSNINNPGQIAIDKIFYLIERKGERENHFTLPQENEK